MTVDEANTAVATAKGKNAHIAAYKALSQAAMREIERLEGDDVSDGYRLISRLIEARNVLTMAAQWLAEEGTGHGHRAIDELDQAMVHITLAIESL